ncbi:MAG: RNA-splicing ligase RtcB, partial [Spirochaetes bacterium]|nr:RNA-splicing ligase RtcB [Spirochaetota bacterium]
MNKNGLHRVGANLWQIPADDKRGMRVPARIYASETLLDSMDDGVAEQAANVATLPGIVSYSLCMPDGHWGYGFPIGGVAAFDPEEGVISPGGIGFDINCGMRLLRTNLTRAEVEPHLGDILDILAHTVPAGVGGRGSLSLSTEEFREVISTGMEWSVARGFSSESDRDHTEERGAMKGADPSAVSERAIQRGVGQVGTLGSG